MILYTAKREGEKTGRKNRILEIGNIKIIHASRRRERLGELTGQTLKKLLFLIQMEYGMMPFLMETEKKRGGGGGRVVLCPDIRGKKTGTSPFTHRRPGRD